MTGLAAVMAAGTLIAISVLPGPLPAEGAETAAGTVAFTTFALFQLFNLLNLRSDTASVFNARTLANRAVLVAILGVVVLQVLVVSVPALRGFFDTAPLGWREWLLAAGIASSALWLEEIRKFFLRRRGRTLEDLPVPRHTAPVRHRPRS
ncbi:cation-translocating P-type ATPase C-terminal domain-containing protein [Frankia tisae]|uniref:cation-translocating P-type ATPase C-terminal domain-containing protein n=1 Tax=Frankia tisae TaxID=2950104 RepID=UPI0021C1DA58|nr:cation-translocating P-type ATPase C-terminal domain-containing protein [Frankia tisae]